MQHNRTECNPSPPYALHSVMEKSCHHPPLSKKELTIAYERSYETLRKWLAPHLDAIGEYAGGSYTPRQVGIIFDRLGDPPNTFWAHRSGRP